MSPRDDAQLALQLSSCELSLSGETRAELVSALAELLLVVARARCIEVNNQEDGDDREAGT
jgi:hypothetical protein